MLTIKLEPIDRDIKLTIDQLLSDQARADIFAASAQNFIDEADAINRQALGKTPKRTIYVDGHEAELRSATPNSTVVVEWELFEDFLSWVANELIMHSPRLTGRYARNHTLFADGRQIDLRDVPEASEYVFLNLTPYAVKIEPTGRRPAESRQAPEGVYSIVARLAAVEARNRGLPARVTYSFRAAVGAGSTSTPRTGRATGRSPAIIVTVR